MSNLHDEHITALPPLIRAENLSVRVATILKRYILAEQLEPGHRLPAERRLADWLNVSRVVLREALSQLMGEGLLESPSPYILCVASFDRAKLAAELSGLDHEDAEANDLIQLRVVLELGAIDAIVAGATDAHLREIERWVIEGERTLAAGEPIYRADAGFHAALLKSLDNQAIDRGASSPRHFAGSGPSAISRLTDRSTGHTTAPGNLRSDQTARSRRQSSLDPDPPQSLYRARPWMTASSRSEPSNASTGHV